MTDISYNFNLGKVLAVLAVITGHFYAGIGHMLGSVLWFPALLGLMVFAFSSGYFTSMKYSVGYSIRNFWHAKVTRLLGPLLLADIFLICLFLYRGQENVFNWQSTLAWFGCVEVIRWFGMPRDSPFGNGLWFLTQLLIFYAIYPVLERSMRSRGKAMAILLISLTVALVFESVFPMGVYFWTTAWFFILALGEFRWESLQGKLKLTSFCRCKAQISTSRFLEYPPLGRS